MDITYIGNSTYILSAERQEFDTYYITKEHAKNAVRSALNLPFLPRGTAIDLYEGDENLMIFTRIPSSFYSFDNFEDVIAACKSCSVKASALYLYDDEYILSVSLPAPVLEEFSCRIDVSGSFELFLKEHGKVLIPSDAVNFVKNTF